MALIACPQCTKTVSDAAVACTNCGQPIVSFLRATPRPVVQPVASPAKGKIMLVTCPGCTRAVSVEAAACPNCGQPIAPYVQSGAAVLAPVPPTKQRGVAAAIAILLGGIGGHKFYLGKTRMGLAYLLFSWTAIPTFIGIVEGIVYLCMSDESFAARYSR